MTFKMTENDFQKSKVTRSIFFILISSLAKFFSSHTEVVLIISQ